MTKSALAYIKIPPHHIKIEWEGATPVSSHRGNIKVKEARFHTQKNSIKKIQAIIDMTSLKNTDIESKQKRTYLEKHLKSKDFFDTTIFPTASITVEKIKMLKGGRHQFHSSITIKNITKKVIHYGEIKYQNQSLVAKTKIVLSRNEYGIRYRSKSNLKQLKNQIIRDDIVISVEINPNHNND